MSATCEHEWPPAPEASSGDDFESCPECLAVEAEPVRAPWHFKLLVGTTAVYLGWRAWQGVAWLLHRL